jgi:hypothetical protein
MRIRAERPPNTRMQRTRSSPSALRSPLMRCPLGSRGPGSGPAVSAWFHRSSGTGEMIKVS